MGYSESHTHHLPNVAQARAEWRRRDHLRPEKGTHRKKGQVLTPIVNGLVRQGEIVEGGPVPDPNPDDQEHVRDGGLSQPMPQPMPGLVEDTLRFQLCRCFQEPPRPAR